MWKKVKMKNIVLSIIKTYFAVVSTGLAEPNMLALGSLK